MKKFEIELALDEVGKAKRAWAKAQTKFNSDITALMTRLLHEAAHNYMSAEDVAKHTGFTVKRVRQLMRDAGLNPRDGKNMLSKIAADALTNNAALMGIEPHEMDLMSPLAYLPMGEEMKRELRAKAVAQVHEVSENPFEEFYAEHYSDWTVHELTLRVFVPTKDSPSEESLALVREVLDDAGFDIKVARA